MSIRLVSAALATLLFYSIASFGQEKVTMGTSKGQVKWATNPFDHRVFVENLGQFDGNIPGNEKILYGAQLGKVTAYFTIKGVIYRYNELQEAEEHANEPDEETVKSVAHYLMVNWDGSNSSSTIEAAGKLSSYYTYPKGTNQTIRTDIFRKITYMNIYPGIDIEFEFPKDKDGIKYSVVVHPGADISVVKFKYSGADRIKLDPNGCVIIDSKVGPITDHAPFSCYDGGQGSIATSYKINGNIQSFMVRPDYDKTKTLIIDPWWTDPLFTNLDKAYTLDWDNQGNVYAYGGSSNNSVLQLVKMDNAGNLQWTFNASAITSITTNNDYGGFCTDKVTGTSYLLQGINMSGGAMAEKVNTLGNLVTTFPGYSDMLEFWIGRYDQCHGKVIIGGGGTSAKYQAAALDTNMLTMDTVDILGTTAGPTHDICLLALDPDGLNCYMATVKASAGPLLFNNDVVKVPVPTLSPTIYVAPDGFWFQETHSVYYSGYNTTPCNFYAYANAMNGAAASPNWLYLYNSDTIKRINKNTGARNSKYVVRSHRNPYVVSSCPPNLHDTNWMVLYGGIDVDFCDNLFVGVADSIYVLDSSFAVTSKIRLHDTVYDVRLGRGNALYACGKGFVAQIINPTPNNLHPDVVATSCSNANGRASVNPSISCGTGPFYYMWSTGATTQAITGVSAGTYTVTVTDSTACLVHSDTAILTVVNNAGLPVLLADTNPVCMKKGSITVTPTGGTPPFTYSWSNGQTNQKDTGLVAGTYTCTIKDQGGCSTTVSGTLVSSQEGPLLTVCCDSAIKVGDSVMLYATGGGVTYSWSPSTDLSCTNCSDPVAKPLNTTVYCVTADSGSCQNRECVTITTEQPCGSIFVPNAFSPNGDNVDDIEYVYGGCIQALEFKVYDRWGNMVFETTDPSKGWDGTYNGKPMNSGVYDYTLVALQLSGKATDQKGSITLIR
jgi:gliding motility-associated-like protein